VKADLDALPSQTPAQTDWEFHEEYLAAIQVLLGRYPGDVFVASKYIRFMFTEPEREKMIEEYKAKLAHNPEDPRLAYLYGLTLIGRQSGESINLFTTALEKDPEFPLPHVPLADIYSAPAFLDKSKTLAHLKAFLETCPDSFDGYEALAKVKIEDKELVKQFALKLRAIVEKRSDADAVGAYRTLWLLEFQTHPLSQYDGLRKQVTQDLQRIRALDLQDKSVWYETLEEGYKLANDQAHSDRAKQERESRFPDPWHLNAQTTWMEEHALAGDASPERKRAYYQELVAQSNEWFKQRPNLTYLWWDRLRALAYLEDVPAADVEAAGDQLMRVAEKNAGPPGPDSGNYFIVAGELSRRHLQPERVVLMAQKGLAKLEIESRQPFDLETPEVNEDMKLYSLYRRLLAIGYETDGHLQLKQADNAQVDLLQTDERLHDLKSLAGDKQERKLLFATVLSAYWGRMARLAELRGHKLDAMAFYQNALLTRLDAKQKPDTEGKDELAEDAQRLWTGLGGSSEGWQLWYGRRADALAKAASLTWEDATQPLPAFSLTDLEGKSWNLETLKGKVTFLNFWASW
jgi:hypothetical protein